MVDWLTEWDNLLQKLVQKFNSPEQSAVNGVLLAENSIQTPSSLVLK
jgi:hypothetical protein